MPGSEVLSMVNVFVMYDHPGPGRDYGKSCKEHV